MLTKRAGLQIIIEIIVGFGRTRLQKSATTHVASTVAFREFSHWRYLFYIAPFGLVKKKSGEKLLLGLCRTQWLSHRRTLQIVAVLNRLQKYYLV